MGNQQNTHLSFRKFAERILATEPPKSVASYALASLLDVMRREGMENPDENLLRLWIATMAVEGRKISTCKRYFGKVRTIHNVWLGEKVEGADDDGMFAQVQPQLNGLLDADCKGAERNLALVKRLLTKNEKSEDWQTVAIFLYLFYTPSAGVADVAELTFGDERWLCSQADEIVNSFDSSHGRKYVFALKQGKSRPHEIAQNLTRRLQQLLMSVGMRFEYGFSRASITAMWVAAALRCGISLKDIKGCIGMVPPEYQALSILGKCNVEEADRERIVGVVADSINDNAKHWFVMKLRPGVSADDIKASIADKLPGRLSTMMFFYPTHSQVRKEGKKRIVEEIPYLPNVLFFNTQRDKVKSLFATIGDQAWCFRISNSPDSEYSMISNRQMTAFQQCVGQFTPDIRMELVDLDRPLERGRRVKIVGGIMAGYEGEILDVKGEPGNRIFSLAITDRQHVRWVAHVEDVNVREEVRSKNESIF